MTTIPVPAAWRTRAGELRYLAAKVARVHGAAHPDLATLAEAVDTLTACADGDCAGQAALAGRLAALSGGFRPWPGACASVHQLFQGLAAVAAELPAQPQEQP